MFEAMKLFTMGETDEKEPVTAHCFTLTNPKSEGKQNRVGVPKSPGECSSGRRYTTNKRENFQI